MMLSLRSPRLNSNRFVGVEEGSGGMKRSFIRGGGAIGGGILRMVADSPRLCIVGRRSGELPPCGMFFNGALAGILDGLLLDAEQMAEGGNGRNMHHGELDPELGDAAAVAVRTQLNVCRV